jgi:hypothetical protein
MLFGLIVTIISNKKERPYAFPPFLATFVLVGAFADWLYWTIDENTIVISEEDTIF